MSLFSTANTNRKKQLIIEAKNTPIEFDKAPQNMGGRFSSYCKANSKLLQK